MRRARRTVTRETAGCDQASRERAKKRGKNGVFRPDAERADRYNSARLGPLRFASPEVTRWKAHTSLSSTTTPRSGSLPPRARTRIGSEYRWRSDEEGLALLEKQRVHVLVASLDAFGRGEEFVRRAATIQPLLGIVLLADPGRINQAKQPPQGPIQYVPKPVTREALRSAIARALERQFRRGPASNGEEPAAAAGPNCAEAFVDAENIIAASKAMNEILELVRRCGRPTRRC